MRTQLAAVSLPTARLALPPSWLSELWLPNPDRPVSQMRRALTRAGVPDAARVHTGSLTSSLRISWHSE